MLKRVHIVLPDGLVEEVDKVAGKGHRSRFVEDAIREKLSRQKLGSALAEAMGSIDLADYPQWSSPEAISSWVRQIRQE